MTWFLCILNYDLLLFYLVSKIVCIMNDLDGFLTMSLPRLKGTKQSGAWLFRAFSSTLRIVNCWFHQESRLVSRKCNKIMDTIILWEMLVSDFFFLEHECLFQIGFRESLTLISVMQVEEINVSVEFYTHTHNVIIASRVKKK